MITFVAMKSLIAEEKGKMKWQFPLFLLTLIEIVE